MYIAFEKRDVDAWAAYSGDYNPIHFSADYARNAGLTGPVVHGMLAVLSVQSSLPPLAIGSQYARFKAFLRRPVPLSEDCAYSEKAQSNGVRFALSGQAGEYLAGTYLACAAPTATAAASDTFCISAQTLTCMREKFASIFPDAPRWAFLSATVFAAYLKQALSSDMRQFVSTIEGWEDWHFADLQSLQGVMVMQTSLSIVHPAAPDIELEAVRDMEDLTWHRSSCVAFGNSREVSGDVTLHLQYGSTEITVVEIGLHARRIAGLEETLAAG